MKNSKWVAFFSILLLFPISAYASLDIMRISLLEGDVQVRTEETGDWVPASINMPIKEGDRVWAAERSRVELNVKDGTYLRLDENSALEVLTLDKDSYQVYLSTGRFFANYKGKDETVLQVDTPDSSIRAYEKARFRIDVSDEGKTEISTFRGAVDAETRDGRTRVDKGRTLYLTQRGEAEFGPFPPPDDWEKWNRQRDTKMAEWKPPSRYLPEDLRPYSRELDDNGRWVQSEEYGYVWTPNVVVSVGWAPYRLGRWTWVGGDYVWVSYEPWGWVPYHYGRWAFVGSFGWCWVPPARGAVYWGPGYVGWVITPTHVSWVPLAPRETYYGRGYYGPHSVNITKVNVTNINVQKVVYRNVHATNAVTVIHRDTFVTGRHVDVKVHENPFLRERVHIGGPDIKPDRTLRMPVVREFHQEKRPPAPIREIKGKEIKENRPLVRGKELSVLRRGTVPREMAVKVREGTPEVWGVERKSPAGPGRKEMEKPKPGRPMERSLEKPGEIRPIEKGIEKPRGPQPGERGMEKRPQAGEKVLERPSLPRGSEKAVEKPREVRPAEKEIEKPRGLAPMEGAVEKSRPLRPAEKGIEKAVEPRVPERGIEKSISPRPQEKNIERGRGVEKEVEKAFESRPAERGMGGREGRGR